MGVSTTHIINLRIHTQGSIPFLLGLQIKSKTLSLLSFSFFTLSHSYLACCYWNHHYVDAFDFHVVWTFCPYSVVVVVACLLVNSRGAGTSPPLCTSVSDSPSDAVCAIVGMIQVPPWRDSWCVIPPSVSRSTIPPVDGGVRVTIRADATRSIFRWSCTS